MATYTLTMSDGATYTLTPAVQSPREGEDLMRAVTDILGRGYWIDRVNPIAWNLRDSRYNSIVGTIFRDDATYRPRVFDDWEMVAKINGNTLTLTFLMLPGRAYWQAPSAADRRAMAREVAQSFGRDLRPRERAEIDQFSNGFHARYSLR